MRRTPLLVAATAAVALLLAGCNSVADVGAIPDKPVRGGILEYGTDVQPVTGGIDPYASNAFAGQNIYVQIYESLLTKDDQGNIEPDLASSWKEVDPLTYRFTLRQGVEFSDGTPLTTADVVFSYQTMQKSGATQAPLLGAMKSVKALDDRTVEFTLSRPSGAFMNLVSAAGTGVIVSKAWYTSHTAAQRARTALGTGPFQLTDWQDNTVIKLRRNAHYWDSPYPYLDGIDFQIIPDDQARIAALRQGTVDAIWLGDQQLAEQVESEGFKAGQNAETRNLMIYLDATDPGPLASTTFRQALSTGIDRKQLATLASYGYGKESLVVPRGDPAAVAPDASTPNYTYDPAKARALLAKSGVKNPTVTITYPSDAAFSRDVAVYEVMQEQLKKVGITLKLNPTPWAEILPSFSTGKFTGMVVVPGTYAPDPTSYFVPFVVPGLAMNKTGDAGKTATALFGRLSVTMGAAREPVLAQLENEVADKALVIVPFVVAQRQEIWSPRLQGYAVDPYSYRMHLKEAWLVP
jgi:peptide/nickel transport system substrate-binding protein